MSGLSRGDVYKRQVQARVNGDAVKPRGKFRAAVETVDLLVSADEPVSYTHLDVYKRQM